MSLTHSIHRGKHMYGEKPALVYGDRVTTYGDLYAEIARCASAFSELDAAGNVRVGILSANCDRAIIGFYGAMWAGMVPNYLNVRWSVHELRASIDDFAPSILLVDDTFLEMGTQLRAHCPSIRHVVHIGEQEGLPDEVLAYPAIIAAATPIEDRSGDADEMAFLNYTGGTTGKGKGVIHTHASHMAGMAFVTAEGFFVKGNTLMTMPLFHIGGIIVTNSGLMLGNALFIIPGFDPLKVLELIQEHKIVQGLMVPTMLQMLLHHPRFSEHDLSSFKYLRYGASPIDETLLMELKANLPWVDFMQIYGQTEGVPATLLHDCDHTEEGVAAGRIRSAGTPCYGVEMQIRDEQGNELALGEIGEIAYRGPHLMTGYLNNPEQTAKALQDGWLVTGDAGYLSDEGFLYVVDRIKDMIVTGGENVYSVEVEGVLYQHAAVDHCAIVGLPDEKWGEKVHAEVVLKGDASLTDVELITHCRDYLATYKLPHTVAFVDAIPLTAVGKIDKVAIRNKYD